ncbi:hypothetical protein [Bacillus sp. JJ1764]|uniref:hypothetical protein n=1 Tax=Bacillus sp. JJ1764 TaxID=3122964 RepID=UPI002FFD989A
MFFFNKEEVYIGFSMEDFSKVREILKSKGIKYTYKIIDHSAKWMSGGTSRGNYGSIGMNSKFEKQYVISVKKKDSENARYWVNSVLY